MINGEFHHSKASVNFVHTRQVENRCANESCKHNHKWDWPNDYLCIIAISRKLVERHYDECELQNKGQNHVHNNIETFLLLDFEYPLLKELLFF